MAYGQSYHTSPERQLWCAVLLAMTNDLVKASPYSRERHEAVRWVGSFPSMHFRLVCDLAGYDPEAVHPILKNLVELPQNKRITSQGGGMHLIKYLRENGQLVA